MYKRQDTNPGFLYQQNTMRDALVAAINLNIFNNHCDTVCMANIAQMVNVCLLYTSMLDVTGSVDAGLTAQLSGIDTAIRVRIL